MAMSSKSISLNSETIVISPDEYATDEDNARAARAALTMADNTDEARMFLSELDVDPVWLRRYVDENGWPR